MYLKLRKISKLNIFVAVFMCALLLFCFCSASYVQAAGSNPSGADANYSLYLPFTNYYTASGYSYYNSSAMSIVAKNPYAKKYDNLGFSLEDNASFKAFVSEYVPDYVSISESFDFYGFSWVYANEYYHNKATFVIVKKGSKIAWEHSGDKSKIQGYNVGFWTDSPYAFFNEGINSDLTKDSKFIYMGQNNRQIDLSSDYSCSYIDIYIGAKNSVPFLFTNMPIFENKQSIISYMRDGDKSGITNSDSSWTDKKEYPAESFYWDDMTCKPSSVGNSKYAFSFNYSYSCPLMKDTSEMFSCKVVYNSDIRYQDGKGRVHTWTDSKEDTFSLNKHRKGYVNDSLYLSSTLIDSTPSSGYNRLNELIDGVVGVFGHVDLDLESNTDVTVRSAKIYVTVFLYHIPDPDTLFSNSNINQSAIDNTVMSTDVRSFSFDLFNLHEDTEGMQVKPTVTTEDVTDGDGNVTDKKVTDVTATDESGKTVINITIDNSNKVIDGNANINTGGGSGGDSDDEDKNTKSFWKYVTGIVAFFTALLNSDSGLFAVIASYFKFIPSDFWNVTIGAIVVIAVLSIYRLAKKGG